SLSSPFRRRPLPSGVSAISLSTERCGDPIPQSGLGMFRAMLLEKHQGYSTPQPKDGRQPAERQQPVDRNRIDAGRGIETITQEANAVGDGSDRPISRFDKGEAKIARPEVEPVERARDPPVWCEHEHRRRMSELIVFRIIGGAIAERDGDPFERGLAGDQESGGIRKGSILSDLRRL